MIGFWRLALGMDTGTESIDRLNPKKECYIHDNI